MSRHPPLVPHLDEVQEGFTIPGRELRLADATVRLFTLPGAHEDPARTVLCLPGLGASGRSFALLRPHAPDWRWLFWTPPLETPAAHTPADYNVGLLADAIGKPGLLPERFALVGSSYGSLLALRFALEHPERVSALVLVSPVASTRRIRHGAVFASSMLRVPLPFAYAFAPVIARALGGSRLTEQGRSELVREARRISPREMVRRLRDILAADLLPRLGELSMPTLVVHGGRDVIVPLRAGHDVAARIPHAQFEVIRSAGHLPYMSHPDVFGRLLHHFLTSHLEGTTRGAAPAVKEGRLP